MKFGKNEIRFAPNANALLITVCSFALGLGFGIAFLLFMILVTFASVLAIKRLHPFEKHELSPYSFFDKKSGKHFPSVIEIGEKSKRKRTVVKFKTIPVSTPDEAVAIASQILPYLFEKPYKQRSAS